jgi:hypothetical protein
MKPKCKSKFGASWLDVNKHPGWTWLQKELNNEYRACCTMCNVNFDVSNMGISSVVSHEKGKKHQLLISQSRHGVQLKSWARGEKSESAIQAHVSEHEGQGVHTDAGSEIRTELVTGAGAIRQDVCTGEGTSKGNDNVEPVTVMKVSSSKGTVASTTATVPKTATRIVSPGSRVENFMVKDEVTRAEIIWALNSVMSHTSLRGSANAAHLFPLMFPDSEIASRFQMKKDKAAYIVSYGLGPYFQNELSSMVQKCDHYAISFDESLNKVAQEGQMDIVVRFWDEARNAVATRYLTSAFLGHATADDLLHTFTSALAAQNLNLKNMIQVSMDGPNVNLKFLRELQVFLKNASDPHDPELLNIGSCSLHVVHGAYKTAHNACGWQVHIFLRSLYYLFKDFPSRRADYTAATKSSLFPLRFCAIRWVENSSVIRRALDILPLVKVYIEAVARKAPDSQTFVKVKKAVGDRLLTAKLGFLQSIALQLEPFLVTFQSNKSLLPFMYGDLYSLLRNLMQRFIKNEVMGSVNSAAALMAIDICKKDNHKLLQNIDIGFAASTACKSVGGIEGLKFREECCTYMQHLCKKMTEKCPLKYTLCKGATCLNPKVMLSNTLSKSRITIALEVFIEKNRVTPGVADIIKREYIDVCGNSDVRERLQRFNRDADSLDEFFNDILTLVNASASLKTFVHQILTLFHGNAAVERSFSINKECLVENLLNDSLVAQRVVHDAVSAAGGVPNVEIPKKMIHSIRNASSKRIEAAKSKVEKEDKEANRRKRIADDIKLLEVKKARVVQDSKDEMSALDDELCKLRQSLK